MYTDRMKTPTTTDPAVAATLLNKLRLNQTFTSALDGERGTGSMSRQVANAMWSEVAPTPPREPRLIAWVPEMAQLLGIDIASEPELAASIFTGAQPVNGSLPYAMRYGGHQFGNWAGQLGDGRAIALGELQDTNKQTWTLQLNGAGPTPYSRQGDGYAVLRSSVREYLCSEAMFHLGIPTTRSLTLCLTGEDIERDVFYNGNVETEQGAILCRAAESFVRFGSFEIHAAHREDDQLKQLADYVITRHYPHLVSGKPSIDTYQQWFNELLERTAHLVAHWQRVGFVHAVMNTDNMSILGQTIDYGPYGWLEEYDLRWTPNFVDLQGRRYSYGNQPRIALWNLYRLANAILPLFDDNTEPLEDVLSRYEPLYENLWNDTRAAKIGLKAYDTDRGDKTLLDDLWDFLEHGSPDYTLFFRTLSDAPADDTPQALAEALQAAFYNAPDHEQKASLVDWLGRWKKRIEADGDQQAQARMQRSNPKYVLRNYIALQAIDAAENGDFSVLEEVSNVMRKPYDDQPQHAKYAGLRPDWATQRPGCTMLTCSS